MASKSSSRPDKKSKRKLQFEDADDDTPLSQLIRLPDAGLSEITPQKQNLEEPFSTKTPGNKERHKTDETSDSKGHSTKRRSARKVIKFDALTDTVSRETADPIVPTEKFTFFKDMLDENTHYSFRMKILHFWYINTSALGNPPIGFLLVKDEQVLLSLQFFKLILLHCLHTPIIFSTLNCSLP